MTETRKVDIGRPNYDQRARDHFLTLPHAEQAAAIRRLAASGMSDYGLAHATGLSVEMIRRVLAERAHA